MKLFSFGICSCNGNDIRTSGPLCAPEYVANFLVNDRISYARGRMTIVVGRYFAVGVVVWNAFFRTA